MPKKIFTEELEGTRRRGRPRKGWKGEVEIDLQVQGVRRWRELVADRKTQERMERGSRKRSSSAGSKKMERVGGRQEKMEGHCSTGQSPQWAVVTMEEKEEEEI